jgi:hypothetical protein
VARFTSLPMQAEEQLSEGVVSVHGRVSEVDGAGRLGAAGRGRRCLVRSGRHLSPLAPRPCLLPFTTEAPQGSHGFFGQRQRNKLLSVSFL